MPFISLGDTTMRLITAHKYLTIVRYISYFEGLCKDNKTNKEYLFYSNGKYNSYIKRNKQGSKMLKGFIEINGNDITYTYNTLVR